MFRTRTRKILRDVWTRKIRTLLVATSIFIGVFGVVTLISAGELLVNQLESDLQEDRLAMMTIGLTVRQGVDVDNVGILDSLAQQPDVTAIEGRAAYPLYWRTDTDDEFNDGTIVAHVTPYEDAYIQPTRLIEGRYPVASPPDILGKAGNVREIAVERRMADKYELGIGDTLEMRVLSVSSDEVVTVTGEIVGIVFQPYGNQAASGLVEGDTTVFASYPDAQYIAGFTGINGLYVRFTNFKAAEAHEESFKQAIAQNSPYIPVLSVVTDPAENQQIESTRATNSILVSLAFIALAVSGFLVINVVGAIVSEQRRQIGTMKSLGATEGDTLFMYAGIATAYGLIGVIPGVLLGIPSGYYAAQGLAAQSQTVIDEFSVSPTAIMLGAVIGLLVPFLSSLFPVWSAARISIREAMTDFGIDARFGRGGLEKRVGHLPMPLGLRQAVNSAFKKKYRLALTGITLTMANGAFMGIFAVFFGLSGLVDSTFSTFGYQIALSPNEGQEFETVKTLLLDNVDGIAEIEPGINLAITIQDYDAPPVVGGPPGVNAIGFNTNNPDITNLDLTQGTGWEDDPERDGVVIASRIATYSGLGEGDTITISAGGNKDSFEIIGVANYPFDAVWFKWEQLAEFGGLTIDGVPYANSFSIVMDEDQPSSDAVDDKIDEINDLMLLNGVTANYTNWVALAELITQIVVIFGFTLSLAALLIAAVGGVGLLTTLSISVFERQKEIGVMRSLGATSWAVATQFLFEGVVVGVVSWLLAIPLSLLIRQGLISTLPFTDVFEIPFPPATLVVGLVGMLFLVTVASLWPSLSAARKTVSDILRYQ